MKKGTKLGAKFVTTGLDPSTGKERIDVIITSRHDLLAMAKQQAQSRKILKDIVWTPTGFEPINPEYLARGIAAREEQSRFKLMDETIKTQLRINEQKTISKHYQVPVKDPFIESLKHAESDVAPQATWINKIAGWFKKS